LTGRTQLVPDVEQRQGHIACDAKTRSEIVVPVRRGGTEQGEIVGVLDVDCMEINGFDKVDLDGLEELARLVGKDCDW